ncbi:protoheme IX farnesyltransferase [Klebsiella pneumoniae]|uniref:Protoheme IX farnesyltransferase n=1 Tax=Klebsiella pneumoniae TaxID=573 RepID=A0A377UVY9_KLEPN|nr:protoheme IX farnesyltransferase [Klebsiella pneumoniae]
MPHSYAIAIFRFKDYQAANIPVLPVVKGISVAKNHITLYIVAFAVATLMLSLGGYAGYKYLVVAAAVSVWWLAWRCVAIKWPMIKSGRVSCSSFLSSPSPRCP